MRLLKTALVLATALPLMAGAALACDKDKTSAKVESDKHQTAQTNQVEPVRDASKPSG